MKDLYRNLDRNNFFYNYFLQNKIVDSRERLSDEELTDRIMLLARFAWRNHPGYYHDGRIENVLFEFGVKLDSYPGADEVEHERNSLLPEHKKISILHLATELCQVGGHTRILYQFVKRNKEKNQVIVLTKQCKKKIPQWLLDGIGNIPIISLDSIGSVFERACLLRQLSNQAKKVILYHHPWDAVPVIALSHKNCPPVLLENHAHSWFWLGASVADMVFTHSSFHKLFTEATRPVSNVMFLPFTQLDDLDMSVDQEDKQQSRERLGIPADCVCLITLGTSEKFIPNADYNFYATAQKIVRRFRETRIYVIGSYPDETYPLDTDRIQFLGYVDDPTDYYRAADICLDALPQPSLGATLYATLIGMACPMYKYGVNRVFNTANFSGTRLYKEYVGAPETEEAYLNKLGYLIHHPEVRQQIAAEIRQEYATLYAKEQLEQNLIGMFEIADRLEHAPALISEGAYIRNADSAEIADAGSLQDIHGCLMFFDHYFGIPDKLAILARLLINPRYTGEVLQLVASRLKRKVRTLCSGGFYGTSDSVLSASVSSHSGE